MSTWSDYSMGDDSESPYLHRNLWAAWMPMFGATGSTLFDASGRSFHADANNKTNATDWVVQGGISAAYSQYSNATGRFVAPALSTLAGQREATISCWVWLVSTPTITSAIYQDTATGLTGARFGLLWTNGGNIQFQMRDPYTQRSLAPLSTTTTTETYGRWSHWAAVYSAGAATHAIYRDGQLVRTGANTGDQIRSTSVYSIGIGGRISSSAEEVSCDMYLAELRLWNRALSSEEVRELGATPGAGCRRRSRVFRVASLAGDVITGTSSVTSDNASSNATGDVVLQSVSAVSTESAACSAVAEVTLSGAAAAYADACTASALAVVAVAAAGAAVTDPSLASAAGLVSVVGDAATVTEDSTASAVAGSGTFGSAAVQLADATSQCAAEQSSVGEGSAQTACSGSAAGLVSNEASASVVLSDTTANASGFVGFQGQASALAANAVATAIGTVQISGTAAATTADAAGAAVGSVPISGIANAILQNAVSSAAGLSIQVDIEITGAIGVSTVYAAVGAPMLPARVRLDFLRGRKIWR